jgi:ATP-dependent DNA helicase RecG
MTISSDPLAAEVDRAVEHVRAGGQVEEIESHTLDCKEQVGTVDRSGQRSAGYPQDEAAAKDLADTAACFANSDGGSIVVGVMDKGRGSEAFVGTSLDADWLRKRIWDLTDRLTVDIQQRLEEGARLLIIRVPKGVQVHRVGRKAKHRVEKNCVEMLPQDQQTLIERRTNYDWSAEPTDRTIDDVSAIAIERAREYLREAGDPDADELAELAPGDLLRRLGVASADGQLNRAGALVFCPPEAGATPLVSYKHREAPGGDSTQRLDPKPPLIEAYARVKQAIDARNDLIHLRLASGVNPQIRRIPDRAAREAIINALMHRDWRLSGPVDVEFAGSKLTVDSPGGFVHGVTAENILVHPSQPRNATLTGAFRVLRLAEQEGVGVDRMYREMIRAGHAPPEITESGGRVRCVLLGGQPVEPMVELTSALPKGARDDVDIALIVHTLLDRPSVGVAEMQPLLQKGPAETLNALRRAEQVDLVEPTASTRTYRQPHFRFTKAVQDKLKPGGRLEYTKVSRSETQTRIIKFLVKHPAITPADIRQLVGVGQVQASRIATRAREDGILAKANEQATGRKSLYVRGPRFGEFAKRYGVKL